MPTLAVFQLYRGMNPIANNAVIKSIYIYIKFALYLTLVILNMKTTAAIRSNTHDSINILFGEINHVYDSC
jgi:hypothetical protein